MYNMVRGIRLKGTDGKSAYSRNRGVQVVPVRAVEEPIGQGCCGLHRDDERQGAVRYVRRDCSSSDSAEALGCGARIGRIEIRESNG